MVFLLIEKGRAFCVAGWICALLAMIPLAGVDVVALQTAGWVTMTVEFASESGLARGLERTFSGKEPCRFCKVAMKEQEKNRDPVVPTSREIDKAVAHSFRDAVGRWVDRRMIGEFCEDRAAFSRLSIRIDPPPPRRG